MKLPKTDKQATSQRHRSTRSVFQTATRQQMVELIWKHHGISTLICAELDVNYCQLWAALRKWELVDELRKAKESFIDEAHRTIFDVMQSSKSESNRLKAAELVLRYSAPKEQQTVTVQTRDASIEIRRVFGLGGEDDDEHWQESV